MKPFIHPINNEEGFIMIVALVVLVLLTIIGTSATNNTSVELKISANDKFHKIAFYSAEAARGYVAGNTGLYGSKNIAPGVSHYFPNDTDPYEPNTDDPSQEYTLGSYQQFRGSVWYVGSSDPPRGSGYEAGKFKAHRYVIESTGTGPNNAESVVRAGFYRIGF